MILLLLESWYFDFAVIDYCRLRPFPLDIRNIVIHVPFDTMKVYSYCGAN